MYFSNDMEMFKDQGDISFLFESLFEDISEYWWSNDSDYEKLYQNKNLSTEFIFHKDTEQLKQSFISEETRVLSTPINSEFDEWFSNQPEISEIDWEKINNAIIADFSDLKEKSPNQNVTSKKFIIWR